MTTHDNAKIVCMAKEAGIVHSTWDKQDENAVCNFYAIAFEDGRKAEREDAERYRFLRGYMASERTDLDDEFVSACSTNEPEILDEFIDSSIRARGDTK